MQTSRLFLIASACLMYVSNALDIKFPQPKFCDLVIPQYPSLDNKCPAVSASPCHCPPPLRTLFGGSLPCEVGGVHTYGMALIIGKKFVLPWDQTLIERAKLTNISSGRSRNMVIPSSAFVSESGDPAVHPTCRALYVWGEWEEWSEWTVFYNSVCQKQRRRSRPCSPIKEGEYMANINKAHHCDTTIGGNVTDARTEEEVKLFSDSATGKLIAGKIDRTSFINPRIGERLGWIDYILLGVSIVILILIIVAIVLIVKLVKL
ncbi:unnamed protein product [Calicophoron daubneyi]|uniref:Uncharacterized protein n=1 Tax=Calicophoron daubneyi TaxID=300641 RepID=A0AAV2TQS9_CALDB